MSGGGLRLLAYAISSASAKHDYCSERSRNIAPITKKELMRCRAVPHPSVARGEALQKINILSNDASIRPKGLTFLLEIMHSTGIGMFWCISWIESSRAASKASGLRHLVRTQAPLPCELM